METKTVSKEQLQRKKWPWTISSAAYHTGLLILQDSSNKLHYFEVNPDANEDNIITNVTGLQINKYTTASIGLDCFCISKYPLILVCRRGDNNAFYKILETLNFQEKKDPKFTQVIIRGDYVAACEKTSEGSEILFWDLRNPLAIISPFKQSKIRDVTQERIITQELVLSQDTETFGLWTDGSLDLYRSIPIFYQPWEVPRGPINVDPNCCYMVSLCEYPHTLMISLYDLMSMKFLQSIELSEGGDLGGLKHIVADGENIIGIFQFGFCQIKHSKTNILASRSSGRKIGRRTS